MDEREIFAIGGLSANDAERLEEAARALAEKTTISIDEAVYAIQQVTQALRNGIETVAESLLETFREFEEGVEALNIEPHARRRKRERVRARFIEQRYRAEIRRAEGERLYRRIYKPP